MKLVDRTVSGFADITASASPTPGGGSAAALQGALASALVEMVCSLTVGRKKYAEHEELMKKTGARARELRLKFQNLIDMDSEAYDSVTAALALPKETDGEKSARAAALEGALKACTLTPLEVLKNALEALELAAQMPGKSNVSAASDLGVAALSAKAAAQGANLNILINLGGIKDGEFAGKCRSESRALLEKAESLADGLYGRVLESV